MYTDLVIYRDESARYNVIFIIKQFVIGGELPTSFVCAMVSIMPHLVLQSIWFSVLPSLSTSQT